MKIKLFLPVAAFVAALFSSGCAVGRATIDKSSPNCEQHDKQFYFGLSWPHGSPSYKCDDRQQQVPQSYQMAPPAYYPGPNQQPVPQGKVGYYYPDQGQYQQVQYVPPQYQGQPTSSIQYDRSQPVIVKRIIRKTVRYVDQDDAAPQPSPDGT